MQHMAGVRVKDNEPIESAIRRFKKQCEKAGILAELRKREHYEKPSVRRKKQALAARHLMRPMWAEAIGCAGLFVAVNLVTHVLGALTDRIARALFLGGVNRVAGAVFGLAKGAALVGFALLVAERVVPSGTLTQVIAASRLGRPLTELATGVVGVGRTLNPTGPASPGAGNHQA